MYDTIVVGGGLAGLTAAHRLMMTGKTVLVLEACDYPGGRIKAELLAGTSVDIGADRIRPEYTALKELIHFLDIELTTVTCTGPSIMISGKDKIPFESQIPESTWLQTLNQRIRSRQWRLLMDRIDLQEPWKTEGAAQLDQIRLSSYLQKRSWGAKPNLVLQSMLETYFGRELGSISLLEALYQLKSNKWEPEFLHQNLPKKAIYLRGGVQEIIDKLCLEVNIASNRIVKRIDQDDSMVTISGHGFSYQAKWIVVALPPHAMKEIRFDPIISNVRQGLWNQMAGGRILKFIAVFEHPFWKTTSWSGQAFFSGESSIQYMYDPVFAHKRKGILVGVATGRKALSLIQMNPDRRKRLVLASFCQVLGPKAGTPTILLETNWSDTTADVGNLNSMRSPESWVNYEGILNEPEGRIHWAGTETSANFNGSMEGAVRSGIRAAHEIFDKSRPIQEPDIKQGGMGFRKMKQQSTTI